MDALAGPFDLLELQPGESKSLEVQAATLGTMVIHPSYAPQGKTIQVLRLHVLEADKPTFPYYYDVTSQTLIAQLAPQVTFAGYKPRRFTITKVGSGPSARFQLSADAQVVA
jgi:hypothetical protein